MIQIKYKALFDLEFLHSFYTSGKCPDIEMVPTAECTYTMQRFGLKFLPTDFGGKLFAKVKTVNNKDLINNPLPNGATFSFILKLKTSVFENFTELNLTKPRTNHYYFNNLVNNVSADGFPLLVANTTSKIVSDADLLPFISNSFSYTHSSTVATVNSELDFIDSGEQFSQSLDNYNNVFNFTYDLKTAKEGRIKFFVEGVEKAAAYVIAPIDNADAFGVVEIFYNDALPAAYQFQQADNAIETKSYKITFTNRATKWRYIVTKQFNQAITGISIGKTNGTPINFTAQPGAPAGQFVMASNNALPLKEAPVAGIKLRDQANKLIIANLPNPSFNLVKREGADTFSDILITI
ncbi:hypothetical protein FC093_07375 [Ilyomonas limi]|uniref:Uncharacterized protein n=1 Tax=Ilyomonas limi TaxID=2575867 RepID=A0A4U3L665_9BACT|nr:hypothetical protein [Ilyomonas limi]TKK69889.1 hypothetical protein FC093_07375 [Ilyomonas limi]